MNGKGGLTVAGLLLVALLVTAYRTGRLALFGQAAAGSVKVNR
jgi:hypothetical protein